MDHRQASARTILALGATCAALGAACAQANEAPPQMCTRIGCESGVRILLGSGYATPVTVQAGPVGGAMQNMTCDDAVECTAGVFFPDMSAPELRVRLITGTDTTTRTVRPTYEVTQPNGPDCPPTCRQAVVRFDAAAPEDEPALPSGDRRVPQVEGAGNDIAAR